jgi:hypothetical protein
MLPEVRYVVVVLLLVFKFSLQVVYSVDDCKPDGSHPAIMGFVSCVFVVFSTYFVFAFWLKENVFFWQVRMLLTNCSF